MSSENGEITDPRPDTDESSLAVGENVGKSSEEVVASVIGDQIPEETELIKRTYLNEGEELLFAAERVRVASDPDFHEEIVTIDGESYTFADLHEMWLATIMSGRLSNDGKMWSNIIQMLETQGNQTSNDTIVLGQSLGELAEEDEEEDDGGWLW